MSTINPQGYYNGAPVSYLYIYHLKKEWYLPVLPQSISNSLPISFSPTTIPLSSAPLQTFSSAGPRSVSISLKMHRKMFELEDPKKGAERMEELINDISALALPKYTNASKLVVPPTVLYRAGNEVCIRGIVSGNVTISNSGAWQRDGKLSEIDIQFTIIEVEAFSADYAQNHGVLRSIPTDLTHSVWQNYLQ
jgi:hypothetical protein